MATLIISFEIDGVHHWPNSPYPEFAPVHSHLFKFVFFMSEKGERQDGRTFELLRLRQSLISRIRKTYPIFNRRSEWVEAVDFGPRSCEEIAEEVKDMMDADAVFVGEEWVLGALA